MTNKVQKIREEVVRLKSQLLRGACSSQVAMESRCKEEAYNEVLGILDTMQEPVNEDLEEEKIKKASILYSFATRNQEVEDEDFIEGAKWAIRQMQEEPDLNWKDMSLQEKKDLVAKLSEDIRKEEPVSTKDKLWGLSDGKRHLGWLDDADVLEEPVSERFAFKAIPRLLEMIEPTDRAKAYTAKLADTLEVEGYSTDAKIVRESLKIMNGEKVPMATMDEEPVSDDLDEEIGKYCSNPENFITYIDIGFKQSPIEKDDIPLIIKAIKFGANWQKEQMMKKAVDGVITFDYYSDDKTYGCVAHDSFCLEDRGLRDCDKVKIIVVKED